MSCIVRKGNAINVIDACATAAGSRKLFCDTLTQKRDEVVAARVYAQDLRAAIDAATYLDIVRR